MRFKLILLVLTLWVSFADEVSAETGIASVYGNKDGHEWTRTANGELVNPREMTAAHRTLPLGTRVEVTNKTNGKTAVVRITDRGPFVKGRIIDVTPAAARVLDFSGLVLVSVNPVM